MIRFPFPVWLFAMRGFFAVAKPEISLIIQSDENHTDRRCKAGLTEKEMGKI